MHQRTRAIDLIAIARGSSDDDKEEEGDSTPQKRGHGAVSMDDVLLLQEKNCFR